MSYKPTTWKKGDKVTSTKLNKIEQGIQGNDSEISELKSGLTAKPDIENPEETDADLYLSDENGNVIAMFEDGHIKTKEFDSSSINVSSDVEVSGQTTDSNGFWIADDSGNGVARLANGNIQMKNFSSDTSFFHLAFSYTNASGSQTITQFFPVGTRLVFAVNNTDVITGNLSNYKVTYSYTDRNGSSHTLGQDYGYNYVEYELDSDAVSVTVTYPTSLYGGNNANLDFLVYAVPSFEVKPTVIKVAADGSGDYTSLRSAVDSITDNSDHKKYEIWLYPGTYNVLSDYTQTEINTDGFKGLWIKSGVSIIGIGQRPEIIIHGELDTTTYDSTKRNDVSTINVVGDITLQNVTITAKYIRYAIHDDTGQMTHKVNTKRYINCKVLGESLTSGGGMERSYGAGGSNCKNVYAKDCDFSDCFALHNQPSMTHPYQVRLDGCTARRFTFTEYPSSVRTNIQMHNCKASYIRIDQTDETASQSMFIEGQGTCGAMVDVPSGFVYETGDCHRFYGVTISAGNAVKSTGMTTTDIAIATSVTEIYGISIGTDNGDTIVQTQGYINSNILGLSGLAVGDYLTIDSDGAVVSGGTSSNAIAVVKMVNTDGTAFAKLMI